MGNRFVEGRELYQPYRAQKRLEHCLVKQRLTMLVFPYPSSAGHVKLQQGIEMSAAFLPFVVPHEAVRGVKTLEDAILSLHFIGTSPSTRLRLALGAAEKLAALHARRVCHGRLTPGAFSLSSDGKEVRSKHASR